MDSHFDSDSLEYLAREYLRNCSILFEGKCISVLVDEFLKADLTPIDTWLRSRFQSRNLKNNESSTAYRKQGNLLFCKKRLSESLAYYTRSLCYAEPTTHEYSLALANRSAVTLEMGKFSDCLKDIELILTLDYPLHLKPKLILRKGKCLQKLGKKNDWMKFQVEHDEYFKSENQDKYSEEFHRLLELRFENGVEGETSGSICEFVLPTEEENPLFANASSKIEMKSNASRGRLVVAKQRISCGEVLFIEKAYAFGCIFDVEAECLKTDKCYNCLNDIISSIPCAECTQCVFCGNECMKQSWQRFHKWECVGMQMNIWYYLGIAFPAFRTLLNGINEGLNTEDGHSFDQTKFGDKKNNYKYMNSLVYHIKDNDFETLVCATTVLRYLIYYTNFFNQGTGLHHVKGLEVTKQFAARLVQHILQLQNNSSLIEHWNTNEQDIGFPTIKNPVACGIFPSVSIMNHSCKPNITNYFIRDTIVVKALHDIEEKEEILNCYGIYYTEMEKRERQERCLNLYNFRCKCLVCSDYTKEMNYFDKFICMKCGSNITSGNNVTLINCEKCGSAIDMQKLENLNFSAEKWLSGENVEDGLIHCLNIRQRILSKYHKNLQETYYSLYDLYKKKFDIENAIKFMEIWVEHEKVRTGPNTHKIFWVLFEAASFIQKNMNSNKSLTERNLLDKANILLKEARTISALYYPQFIIEKMR